MTDSTYTHIAMLMDRSGSMNRIRTDIEGGLDSFVADQKKADGRATYTLAMFDDEYQVVHNFTDLNEVGPTSLHPRGSTALLDSIARLIHDTGTHLKAMDEDKRPGTVIVGILTDGGENASREYTHAQIKQLISAQAKDYGWQFIYMGANQDAIEVGAGIGISADRSLTYSVAAGAAAMGATSALATSIRSGNVRAGYSLADRDAVR